MLYPTKIKDRLAIFFPPSASEDEIIKASFGRWLVGEPFYKLNETWQEIRKEMEANKITATGLKSSTGRYNPSSTGPGPLTNGAISVYTTEENIDAAGFEVIGIVKHDIQYKKVSAGGQFRHRGDRKIILKTLYWNDGSPSFFSRKNGRRSVWKENIRDKWHLNVVKSPRQPQKEHSKMVGYWCVESKIEDLTDLWHSLREQIISGSLGPVKMECPGGEKTRGKQKTNPFVLVFTAEQNVKTVQSALEINNDLILSYSYVGKQHKSCPSEVMKIPSIER